MYGWHSRSLENWNLNWIGAEFSVKHGTSHCRLCREVSSFDSLLMRSLSKKIPKFEPRSWRNTCCEHGRRLVMVVFAAGVPLRARHKFVISLVSFEKQTAKRESNNGYFSAESTLQSVMLYWTFSTNDDTSNIHSPGSDSARRTHWDLTSVIPKENSRLTKLFEL